MTTWSSGTREAEGQRRLRPKVLVVGVASASTGLGRVVNELIPHLSDDFDVTLLALDRRGEDSTAAPYAPEYTVCANPVLGDIFARHTLPGLTRRIRPDAILICFDVSLVQVHGPLLRTLRSAHASSTATAVYCPVDDDELDTSVLRHLAAADLVACPTAYGVAVVERVFDSEAAAGRISRRPPVVFVPHGVDHARFATSSGSTPRQNRRAARAAVLPGRDDLDNAMLILNSNQNIHRKRLDITLDGFARHVRAVPTSSAYLVLNTHLRRCGYDLAHLIVRAGIGDRIIVHDLDVTDPYTDEELNLLYNACQVGVNTSSSEGFGLISFEHAAAGGAQIVTGHAAGRELWAEAGTLIRMTGPLTDRSADPEHLAQVLTSFERDPAVCSKRQDDAHRHARAHPAWTSVGRQWRDLLRRLCTNQWEVS